MYSYLYSQGKWRKLPRSKDGRVRYVGHASGAVEQRSSPMYEAWHGILHLGVSFSAPDVDQSSYPVLKRHGDFDPSKFEQRQNPRLECWGTPWPRLVPDATDGAQQSLRWLLTRAIWSTSLIHTRASISNKLWLMAYCLLPNTAAHAKSPCR